MLTVDVYFRIVARDIGGSDPERMAAKNVEEYVKEIFGNSSVKVCIFCSFAFQLHSDCWL